MNDILMANLPKTDKKRVEHINSAIPAKIPQATPLPRHTYLKTRSIIPPFAPIKATITTTSNAPFRLRFIELPVKRAIPAVAARPTTPKMSMHQ